MHNILHTGRIYLAKISPAGRQRPAVFPIIWIFVFGTKPLKAQKANRIRTHATAEKPNKKH